jgi:hypothetical protein
VVGQGQPAPDQGPLLPGAVGFKKDIGTWIGFFLAPEVISLGVLLLVHFSRQVTSRARGLHGTECIQHSVIMAFPEVARVMGHGQDVQEDSKLFTNSNYWPLSRCG